VFGFHYRNKLLLCFSQTHNIDALSTIEIPLYIFLPFLSSGNNILFHFGPVNDFPSTIKMFNEG
jgi:hypothetical protein